MRVLLRPIPRPLPSLPLAFSRRAAIFGAVAAPAARAVSFYDARLTAMAAEVDRTLDGAAYALAPVHDDADQNARLDRADALLAGMARIPAAGMTGLKAKAKAWLDSDSYDVQEGSTLAGSIAEDIERLYAAGGVA